MQLSFTGKKSIRKNFGKLKEILSIPNLIEVQKKSYNQFLSSKKVSEASLQKGLVKVFNSIFPIEELSDKATLEYLSFRLEKSKFSVEECRQRDLTYSSALKPTLRLVIYDIDQENNTKQVLSAKEQEVYMGDIPLMTPSGTFVINGIERVVVNQIVRSPGAFFSRVQGTPNAFATKVIPRRGVWLEVEGDKKQVLYAKIDRRRKFPVTQLLRIFGFDTDEKIISAFGKISELEREVLMKTLEKDGAKTVEQAYQSIYKKIRPGDMATAENAKSLLNECLFRRQRNSIFNTENKRPIPKPISE